MAQPVKVLMMMLNGCCLNYIYNHSLTSVLAAISMHKGYAFVQFSNPVEAKNAADGEDGRLVLNQNIGKIQLFLFSLSPL